MTAPKFIVDSNVARLARWLRAMGYDAVVFEGSDDRHMIDLALGSCRTIVTRDTQMMKRRIIASGRLKAVLIGAADLREQLDQIVKLAGIRVIAGFSRCLECNRPLVLRGREEVRDLVPPFVYRTQSGYMQCPSCGRVYWKGSHWESMCKRLERLGLGGAAEPEREAT